MMRPRVLCLCGLLGAGCSLTIYPPAPGDEVEGGGASPRSHSFSKPRESLNAELARDDAATADECARRIAVAREKGHRSVTITFCRGGAGRDVKGAKVGRTRRLIIRRRKPAAGPLRWPRPPSQTATNR